MIRSSGSKKSRWEGIGKKFLCAFTSATLALSLAPAAAFASAGANSSGGWYDLPSETKSLTKTETVNGSEHSYTYLSSGIDRLVGGFSQSMYHIMGINGINFDRGLFSKEVHEISNGQLLTDHVDAVAGIMGTSVNSEPDDYLWNSCVKMYNGTKSFVAGDGLGDDSVYITSREKGNPQAYDMIEVMYKESEEAQETKANIPVVIYKEANFISSSDQTFSPSNESDLTSAERIAAYVAIENKRTSRSKAEAYDPIVSSWTTNSGGIFYGTELMYELADAIDTVTEDSRDSDGFATVMSRYVNANKTDSNKYDSAKAIAQRYEDFAKATQYYMIEKINEGSVDAKVAAVICGYQPAKDGVEAAYACRVFDPSVTQLDRNSASYGGRIANSIMNFTTDVNDALSAAGIDPVYTTDSSNGNCVKWYKASDIVTYADAVFVTDCPYGNNIANYLAKNSDGDTLSIYSVDNGKYVSQNENVIPLTNAADASGAKASVYYKYPRHLFGVWYAQGFENCWMAPLAASYMYPDVFTTPENVMAYAAKNFWHINEADLDGVLAATCGDISMTKGASFTTKSADYQSVVDAIMDEGNAYYLYDVNNGASINALNTGVDSDRQANGTKGDLQTHDLSALTARVQSTYTAKFVVKFDSDGGSEVASQTIASGEKATAPANPTRDGFTFDGWYNGSAKYDFSTPVTSKVTLTAHWTEVKKEETKKDDSKTSASTDSKTSASTDSKSSASADTKTSTSTDSKSSASADTKTSTSTDTKTDTTTTTDKSAAAATTATGLAKGKTATTGKGASAAKVKATSATEVAYVAPKSKSTKKVTVPATVKVNGKTYKVTSIKANAFKGSKATSVTVGKNVKTIASKAFNGASKLKSVTLGKGVTKISKNAFKGAKKLTKVTIKSKKLTTKKSLKNAFKGSKVKTVVLKGMNAKQKKAVKKAILKYGGKKTITVK